MATLEYFAEESLYRLLKYRALAPASYRAPLRRPLHAFYIETLLLENKIVQSMGIPGFFTWLQHTYPTAFQVFNGKKMKVDYMYIDLPSTVHGVARKTSTAEDFHRQLHRRLDLFLGGFAPNSFVYFAMDGPAPVSKLMEQRKRRRRAAGPSSEKYGEVKPNQLTTGSVFMVELNRSMMYYIMSRLMDQKHPYVRSMDLFLSDSRVRGEGELKILNRLVRHKLQKGYRKDSEGHLVVGADSDLFLMTMASGISKVYIVPDYQSEILNGRRINGVWRFRSKPIIFSREKLMQVWRQEILPSHATRADETDLALSLAAVAIISKGNDYLPACAGCQLSPPNFPGLWHLYVDMIRQPEFKGKSLIYWDQCSRGSPQLYINRPILYQLLKRHKEQKDSAKRGVYKPEYWKTHSSWNWHKTRVSQARQNPPSPKSLEEILPKTQKYIQGLEWTLNMYESGEVTDYRYLYDCQTAPNLDDLLHWLSQNEEFSETDRIVLQRNDPLRPAACALAILPASEKHLAITSVRHLMDVQTSPIGSLYQECAECKRLAKSSRHENGELTRCRERLEKLESQAKSAQDDAILAKIKAEQATESAIRGRISALGREQKKHFEICTHRRPFPVEEMETAYFQVLAQGNKRSTKSSLHKFGSGKSFSWHPQKEDEELDSFAKNPFANEGLFRFAEQFSIRYPRFQRLDLIQMRKSIRVQKEKPFTKHNIARTNVVVPNVTKAASILTSIPKPKRIVSSAAMPSVGLAAKAASILVKNSTANKICRLLRK